ncbi:MAG: NAD-dependent epimerase/dehydratase family protein [Phycisphaeraceae bacterium]
MKVCVVGGTGVISTPLVRQLLEHGHKVVLFNRGRRALPPKGVRVIEGDRADRGAFERAMQAERCDAAIDMISFSADDAASALRAFRGVKQLIHCSSCAVYGIDHTFHPITEDHPYRPNTSYAQGKVEAERVLWEAHYGEGTPLTLMRPALTFGEGNGLARQLCRDHQAWLDRIRKGKPLLVCGNGDAPFHFLDAEDAAPAFVHALGRERCIGQAYNLVRPPITWAEHHRTAMRVLGREVDLVGLPIDALRRAAAAGLVPGAEVCLQNFGHATRISAARLSRDVPEFAPRTSLARSMQRVIEAQDAAGWIADSDHQPWEDRLIDAQRGIAEIAARGQDVA